MKTWMAGPSLAKAGHDEREASAVSRTLYPSAYEAEPLAALALLIGVIPAERGNPGAAIPCYPPWLAAPAFASLSRGQAFRGHDPLDAIALPANRWPSVAGLDAAQCTPTDAAPA